MSVGLGVDALLRPRAPEAYEVFQSFVATIGDAEGRRAAEIEALGN